MILTVTLNPAVDHTIRIDEQPRSGTVHRAVESGQFDAGGKGINVSQYLSALGTDTVATGLLGGFTGEFIRSELAEESFESRFVELPALTRVNTTVLSDGGEYKFNENGPRATTEAVEGLIGTIADVDPDHVAVAGSIPPGLTPTAIDRIAEAGPWATSVDVGGETLTTLDAHYETCKPNREELAAAVDRPVGTVEAAAAAGRELLEHGYERVVTSLGPDGAVLVTRERTLFAEALETAVVDTVGAGDSLFAGVLAALNRGEADTDALRTGIAVASAVIATSGTSPPPLDDVSDRRADVPTRSVSPSTK